MIPLWDFRQTPSEELPARLRKAWEESPSGLLTVSRRPAKRWTRELDFAHALILSSAPLYELVLWLDPALVPNLPEAVKEEQDYLLRGYQRLFSGELEVEEYIARLDQHIALQERELFPAIAALAPVERSLRELGYEHRGLEKGAASLSEAVKDFHLGKLEKGARERLDLDFFHLLEHHIERERDALIPAWKWLEKALKSGGLEKEGFPTETLDTVGNPLL